jgi:hypothetical protein
MFVSDTLNWKRTALAGTVKIRKERTQFCLLSTCAGFHTAWVKVGSGGAFTLLLRCPNNGHRQTGPIGARSVVWDDRR